MAWRARMLLLVAVASSQSTVLLPVIRSKVSVVRSKVSVVKSQVHCHVYCGVTGDIGVFR